MKKRCIVIGEDFNFATPIKEYWDWYTNPKSRISAMHLGGEYHKELRVKLGKERIIGSPNVFGKIVVKDVEEGYQFVDGARLRDIESPLVFTDTIFISKRDGWVENVENSEKYLKSFDANNAVVVVHVQVLPFQY